jgi:hypothetical protein
MAVNRQLGVNSAIILNFSETSQGTIKGINSLTLPALTRSKIKSEEFGVDFAANDVGGGEHGDISYSGNMITNDTKGQTQLKTYLKNNTKFTNARIYIDTETSDFLAVDATANDAEAGFQVIDHTPGAANKNGTYPFSGKWAVNGLYCIYDIHMNASAGATIAINASLATATIVDPGSNFIDNGITTSHTIMLDRGTTQHGPYKLIAVTSGTLSLATAQTITSGSGITSSTTHKLHAGML